MMNATSYRIVGHDTVIKREERIRSMRVKINRHKCDAHLAFCEQCLGKFLREPLGYERRCFVEIDYENPEVLVVELHSDGRDVVLKLDEEQRKNAAAEGWSYFVDFVPAMYRNHINKEARQE
jgi:hypothetical protein